MHTIRALLFDFDGTLADSFGAITASTNYVRNRHNLPVLTEQQVRQYVGYGLQNLLEKLAPGIEPREAIALYREHHDATMIANTVLFEGVAETLATLRSQGRALAVCSNKAVHFTRRLVDGLGLVGEFTAVLGPEDVPAPKPDPAMLLEALARLKVSKDEAIYVGDMIVDVQTARAAGVPVWIMPNETNDEIVGDRRLQDFREILDLVSE